MKIHLFIDSLCAGGAQRQLVGLAVLLKKKGHDVAVITYHKNDFYLSNLIENDITHYYLSKAENKKLRIFHVIKQLHKDKPDVLISYLSTPNIIACIANCFVKNLKLIVSERNTTQRIGKNERIRFLLYRFANIIVPNSCSQANFIKIYYPQLASKTVTITNFVDTCFFKPTDNYHESSIPTIISVGRITPQKNILNYLEALKKLVEKGLKFKAIWFGNTDQEEYYNSCKLLIEQLELKNYFEFKTATKQIKEEYHKAEIFCLPSIFEGFPNVLCEAMSCGLPVVCSNVCDNPSIVEEGQSGFLFDPYNVNEITSSIEQLLMLSKEKREAMKKFNRERAIEYFSEDAFVAKYLNIIE